MILLFGGSGVVAVPVTWMLPEKVVSVAGGADTVMGGSAYLAATCAPVAVVLVPTVCVIESVYWPGAGSVIVAVHRPLAGTGGVVVVVPPAIVTLTLAPGVALPLTV